MRLQLFLVSGLFGIFNHEIPLCMDERITILHGPNGFGKTIVLRMLDGILRGHYAPLRSILFESLSLQFDDKSLLIIRKRAVPPSSIENMRRSAACDLQFSFGKPGQDVLTYTSESITISVPAHVDQKLRRDFPFLSRIDSMTWQNETTGELLSIDDLVEQFGDQHPLLRLEIQASQEPEWLKAIHEAIPARLVRAQRLDIRSIKPDPTYGRIYSPILPAVKNYSEELASEMQATLARYAAKSQDLDRTFPVRLLNAPPPMSSEPHIQIGEIQRRLEALEQKRARLTNQRFLDPKDSKNDLSVRENTPADQLGVLSIYANDVEEKLGVFDELANKISLLAEIIKKRFQYKQLIISREKGFVFKTSNNEPLLPTDLSSGEQHELVLLYELLFKVKPNSLILIDEPEISLHLAWQVEFLSDLQKLVKISDIDVIIATHSADIIGSRWDLTVELKGPGQ